MVFVVSCCLVSWGKEANGCIKGGWFYSRRKFFLIIGIFLFLYQLRLLFFFLKKKNTFYLFGGLFTYDFASVSWFASTCVALSVYVVAWVRN